MAIYYCNMNIISRNKGRSAVASSAYRAGERLLNEYDGIKHDYRNKGWVEYKEILLPENAPTEYRDRNTLWNAVEKVDERADAVLAREFVLALPQEMNREQQIEITKQFINENLVSQGMCVDFALHNPPVTNDRKQPVDADGKPTKEREKMQFINPHVHIMCTVRPIDENGKWEKKSEVEYLCRRGEEERGFTASEFKQAKEEGWEKQYRYKDGEDKVWLTSAEAKERGLERIGRQPRTTPYGRKNEKLEYWNSKERAMEWRKSWEVIVNEKFKAMQSDIRIDCRSLKAQGREGELPTAHMGVEAANMEKRAKRLLAEGIDESQIEHSEIGLLNRMVKEHNAIAVRFRMENLRTNLDGLSRQEKECQKEYDALDSKIKRIQNRIEWYELESKRIGKKNAELAVTLKTLEKAYRNLPKHDKAKRKEYEKAICEKQERIEHYNDYLQYLQRTSQICGKEELALQKRQMQEAVRQRDSILVNLDAVRKRIAECIRQYKADERRINPEQEQHMLSQQRKAQRSR